jgi:hypothetical protein
MKAFFCALILMTLSVWTPTAGAQAPATNPADITMTVTVVNHRAAGAPAPRLTKGDLVVRQEGMVRPVAGWRPLLQSPEGIDVAVLVDDSLAPNVALQWKDVGGFIRLLPKDSHVAIAYGSYGGANILQPFTSDREQAIKALRIPIGRINEGSSIYLSLVALLRHWPADGRHRMVLLVSNGVDLMYGVLQSEPGMNQNLQRAIDDAQKDGVVVDAIFASGASRVSRNLFLIGNGQSCLARLALDTGGTAYTNGLETPISFSPYLSEITSNFANMYLLTFQAALPAKPSFALIQLSAEPSGIELIGPSKVFLPAGK